MPGMSVEFLKQKIIVLEGIDAIRDNHTDPDSIFLDSARFLRKQLNLDYAGILAKHSYENTFSEKAGAFSSALKDRTFIDSIEVWGKQGRDTVETGNKKIFLYHLPIIMDNILLGNIIAGRIGKPIDTRTEELIKTAESQLDSAVIQSYRMNNLSNREKELNTIYKIDRIRDKHYSFEKMLRKVIQEVKSLVQSDASFIMLYDKKISGLQLTDFTDRTRFNDEIKNITLEAGAKILQKGRMSTNLRIRGLSFMGIPLIMQDEIIGVLGCVNFSGAVFNKIQSAFLKAIASQTDTAIFESMEKRKLKQVLGRAVDPKVMKRILENAETGFLKGERMLISVLYADIRGSTRLAESTDPEMLVSFINDYLETMTGIIFSNEGTVDKYVGDEVMALFGAPFRQDDHALRAVKTGLEMQKAYSELVEKWISEQGIMKTALGVGIATGELIAGEMGGSRRTDYTVIGRTANLGARICTFAKAGEVLICSRTGDMASEAVVDKELETEFKGIGKSVKIYNVVDIRL